MEKEIPNTINLDQQLTRALSHDQKTNIALYLSQNPETSIALLNICFDKTRPFSGNALRILELVCLMDVRYIRFQLDFFLAKIGRLIKSNHVRPASKICECLVRTYYDGTESSIQNQLKKTHRQKITEICFDWLLSDQKVAVQAQAMTCLQQLGTEFSWIHPELRIVLTRDYPSKSAGYQARARMVLKKMTY